LLHQVGDLFELNVKLRCHKVKYTSGVLVFLQCDRQFHTHMQENEQLFVFLAHAAYQVCIRCFYRWCRPRAHKHLVSITFKFISSVRNVVSLTEKTISHLLQREETPHRAFFKAGSGLFMFT